MAVGATIYGLYGSTLPGDERVKLFKDRKGWVLAGSHRPSELETVNTFNRAKRVLGEKCIDHAEECLRYTAVVFSWQIDGTGFVCSARSDFGVGFEAVVEFWTRVPELGSMW